MPVRSCQRTYLSCVDETFLTADDGNKAELAILAAEARRVGVDHQRLWPLLVCLEELMWPRDPDFFTTLDLETALQILRNTFGYTGVRALLASFEEKRFVSDMRLSLPLQGEYATPGTTVKVLLRQLQDGAPLGPLWETLGALRAHGLTRQDIIVHVERFRATNPDENDAGEESALLVLDLLSGLLPAHLSPS